MERFEIRHSLLEESEKIKTICQEFWNSTIIISKEKKYSIEDLPTIIAIDKNNIIGILAYNIEDRQCEIIILFSLKNNLGIGSLLMKKMEEIAKDHECKRIFLITTNDNTDALRFYQKKGYYINYVHPDMIKKYRILKPEIPLKGNYGIPIRDEIELEKILDE